MNQHLARILSAIETAKTHARDALMVFDLDGTLYDNSHRTLRLIQEFAWTHAARLPELYEGVRGLRADEIRYLVKDTLIACGVSDPAVHKEVHGYWFERFFTNDYLLYDLPLPGGAQVVQKLFGAGGVPAYLTGRDAPNMLLGPVRA